MRQQQDNLLRDFEIQQWFYILYTVYVGEGMNPVEASDRAYDDIGIRFCLKKTTIRRVKTKKTRFAKDRGRLLFEMRNNLSHLKQTIQRLERAIDGNK